MPFHKVKQRLNHNDDNTNNNNNKSIIHDIHAHNTEYTD